MEKKELAKSPVVFNSNNHTYTLNDKQLNGVTPIVHWLFPKTYDGIPQSVLNAAADYGTMIHIKCEMYDSIGICDDPVVEEYKRIMEAAGLDVECSEYLVSDEENIASCIDKVMSDDSLGDIKTTSKVHTLNVQVQLSIYAWLYEKQTGRTANKLYLIWLPKPQYGAPEVRELRRICSDWCEATVSRYLQGMSPAESLAELAAMGFIGGETMKGRKEGDIPVEFSEVVKELMTVKKNLDILAEREKELRTLLLTSMERRGEDKWSNDLIQITRKAPYERESIDTKLLKANEPSIYENYKKVTKVAASLTYKIL